MTSIETLASVLGQTLNAQAANLAGQELKNAEKNDNQFAISLLAIVDSRNFDNSIRLASVLYFKNFLNRKWIDAEGNHKLPPAVVDDVKSKIVKLMIDLDNETLKKQVGECISLIANSDFPDKWIDLLDQMVESLKTDNLRNINGVLSVAHSIFKRWRPLFASDELFLEIKFVLDKFCVPFLQLMIGIDKAIDENLNNKPVLEQLLGNLFLCVKLYFDFNCQDIPEFFEDNMNQLMEIMYKYLTFKNDLLVDKDENEDVDILIKLKGGICDLIQLYATRYGEVFDPLVSKFVQSVWDELTSITLQVKYDILVSKLLTFLTSVIKIEKYFDIFNSKDVLDTIITNVILPNITSRESDEELFEDDPIEFIRRDIENNELSSRRSSATAFLKELKDKNESLVTETVMKYINELLWQNKEDNSKWREKDTAISCFIAIATKGNVTNIGVTSTNMLVDVVAFFQENVAMELVSNNANPYLTVDSIRYLYIFRNQFSKDLLVEGFPLLLTYLTHENYVVYTYSAIAIEKVLALKDRENTSKPLFSKLDVKSFSAKLVETLFSKILSAGNNISKISENDYLLKCLMRILTLNDDNFIAEGQTTFVGEILQNILGIITLISENPTNPKFNHFCFECVAIVMKYNSNNDEKFINAYLGMILPELMKIFNQDVSEFIPYALQILAFGLELLYKANEGKKVLLPSSYRDLIKPLISPVLWEMKGNVPALTRLITDIIIYDPTSFSNDLEGLLGVYQKLIASKANDGYGFDLIEIILTYIDLKLLQRFVPQIASLMLTRLQQSKLSKFGSRFVVFICKICLVDSNFVLKSHGKANSLGPEFVTDFIDQLQPNLFKDVFNRVIEPQMSSSYSPQLLKIIVLGITCLITKNPKFHQGGVYSDLFDKTALLAFQLTSHKNYGTNNEAIDEFDIDDSLTVFGSSFSRLISVGKKYFDPILEIRSQDTRTAFLTLIREYVKSSPAAMNSFSSLNVLLQHEL